jgi:FkbM family methyltransferase
MLASLKKIPRRTALWLLRKFNPGDIRLRHHYTRDRFTIDAFKHKGYWAHGKRREYHTMQFLRELIRPGETVLEAGAHIGYLSMYFGSLVGDQGKVIVFEPAPANLKYLTQNVAHQPQVQVIEKAVGSSEEIRSFFVEDVTGQNNSFYSDFGMFHNNTAYNNYDAGGYREIKVQVTTIDHFCSEANTRPDLVKIDIEGAELEALNGMSQTIAASPPRIMVEITRNVPEVFTWLMDRGYFLYSEQRARLRRPEDRTTSNNVFCLHRTAHRDWASQLKLDVQEN